MTARRWIAPAIAALGLAVLIATATAVALLGLPWQTVTVTSTSSPVPVESGEQPSPIPSGTTSPTPSGTTSPKPSGTASPKPAPPAKPAGTTMCGASFANDGMTYKAALAAEDARFGGLDMVRVFFSGAPPKWAGSPADVAHRPVNVSFKFDADDVMAGKYDTAMRTWFASVPRTQDVYWTYYHEPEDNIRDGEFTAAQYRAAWQRLRGLADQAGNPRLRSALVLMEWTLRPASGRNWRDYYPGQATIDVLSWDVYNLEWDKGKYAAPATLFGPIVSVAQSEGRPWAVSEFGSHLATGDSGPARAAWLNASVKYLNDKKAVWAAYFDHDWDTGDYRLRDAAGIAQWKAFC